MKKQKLINGLNEYLSVGGLYNPELMDHQKIRDLLIEVRNYLEDVDESISSEVEFGCSDIPIDEWEHSVNQGVFIPDDGDGYYVVDGKKTSVYVWDHLAPEGTTHVRWYNK